MSFPSSNNNHKGKKRDFLVGITYDSTEEDKGHFAIRRKVPMTELIDEIKGFMKNGHHFPQFPAIANPTVQYAWDLSANPYEDGDCYNEIIEELDKIILQ